MIATLERSRLLFPEVTDDLTRRRLLAGGLGAALALGGCAGNCCWSPRNEV